MLYLLLIGISLFAPLVSYAGISLIYPDSTLTTNVDTSPPITWSEGDDYSQAVSRGFAASFSASDNDAAFTLTVSGLSGGTVTIDKLLNLTATSDVTTFKVKISVAKSGSLDPDTLKFRFWTGATAPTQDGDATTALDLESAVDTETASTINGNQVVYVQIVCDLPASASSSCTVSVQPSSITLS